MGNLKIAFESVHYAIGILIFFFVLSMLFGIGKQFGDLFSFSGIIAIAFTVFGARAK